MKTVLIIFFLSISIALTSCSEEILGPDPLDTPESNFDVLIRDFEQVYPFFECKNVNWDSLSSYYRGKVNSRTTPRELYYTLAFLLEKLKDGHVRLDSPLGNYHYEEYSKYQHNFPDFYFIQRNYLKDVKSSGKFIYGRLSEETGYIYIPVFESNNDESGFQEIDNILQGFSNMKSVVIDIRDNYGGELDNAKAVAGRFLDKKRIYVYSRWKVSPKQGDFSGFSPEYIEPVGRSSFRKPVVILSNRRCYSSAEHFIFALKSRPDVTVIGDTTGGVMGVPVYREMPNGWKYMLPRSIQYDSNRICYEGKGIPPDITVSMRDKSLNSGRDLLIEKAVEHLNASY